MRDANDGTLAVLFDELEIKLGIYNADIITDNYADLILVDKIKMVGKRAVQGRNYNFLSIWCKRLEIKLNMHKIGNLLNV